MNLDEILRQYQQSFRNKVFGEESIEEDDLMLVFGLTQKLKAENKQYWGRELGMCWERLIIDLCKQQCSNYQNAIKNGQDEMCDLVVGKDAIDTKYRIGSGDSGFTKKMKNYGRKLIERNYRPILLILRDDSLPQTLKACKTGGWIIKSGDDSYEYIKQLTQFDLKSWLQARKNQFLL